MVNTSININPEGKGRGNHVLRKYREITIPKTPSAPITPKTDVRKSLVRPMAWFVFTGVLHTESYSHGEISSESESAANVLGKCKETCLLVTQSVSPA